MLSLWQANKCTNCGSVSLACGYRDLTRACGRRDAVLVAGVECGQTSADHGGSLQGSLVCIVTLILFAVILLLAVKQQTCGPTVLLYVSPCTEI